jgi:hypothetical protein
MKFGAKRDPLLAQLGFFCAKFHSKPLYSVEKKIVGISQYAYIRHCDFEPGVPIDIAVNAGKD